MSEEKDQIEELNDWYVFKKHELQFLYKKRLQEIHDKKEKEEES